MPFKNLIKILRIKIAFYISMISVFGYLLFNPLNYNLLTIFVASFFAGVAGYSYNNFFDYEEDAINKRGLIFNKKFLIAPFIFFFLGLILIINFNYYSLLFYSLPVILSWAYSSLRLKKIFLLKNVYTSFGITLIFLFGSSLTDLSQNLLASNFFIFITIFAASICSDLRDYEGDKKAGVNTLPVVIGSRKARWVILISLIFSFYLSLKIFVPATFFVFLMLLLVLFNKPKKAHIVSGLMFFIFNIILLYNILL